MSMLKQGVGEGPSRSGRFFEDRWDMIAGVVIATAFTAWAVALTLKFYAFGYSDWDLAIYDQAMRSMCRGSMSPSLFGMNWLGNHAEYIAFLLLPAYVVVQHPLTLIMIQLVGFFVAAALLYRLARREIGPLWALCVMALFIFYPANAFMLSYEFHFEALALPLLMSMFYGFKTGRYGLFIASAALTCLVKENMPLVVLMFGVAGFLTRPGERVRWGVIPFLLGAAYFFAVMFLVTPWIRSGLANTGNIYLTSLYGHLVGTESQAGHVTLLQRIQAGLAQVSSPATWQYLMALLLPLIFLPVLSPVTFLIAAPLLAQNILAGSPQLQTIFFHYSASMSPVFFVATVEVIKAHIRRDGARPVLAGGLAAAAVVTAGCWLLFWNMLSPRFDFSGLRGEKQAFVRQIPVQASVAATFGFLVHLTGHERLYSVHNILEDRSTYSLIRPFRSADQADLVLLDLWDHALRAYALGDDPAAHGARALDFLKRGNWTIKRAADNLVILSHNPAGEPLVETLPGGKAGEYSAGRPPILQVGDAFSLLKWQARVVPDEMRADLRKASTSFTWRSLRPQERHFEMEWRLRSNNMVLAKKVVDVGTALYPTGAWKPGEIVRCRWSFVLPPLKPGLYDVEVRFYDHFKRVYVVMPGTADGWTFLAFLRVTASGEYVMLGQ